MFVHSFEKRVVFLAQQKTTLHKQSTTSRKSKLGLTVQEIKNWFEPQPTEKNETILIFQFREVPLKNPIFLLTKGSFMPTCGNRHNEFRRKKLISGKGRKTKKTEKYKKNYKTKKTPKKHENQVSKKTYWARVPVTQGCFLFFMPQGNDAES